MNKTELVSAIAGETGLTKKDSEQAVNAFISQITATLKKGEKVSIVGFGNFEVRQRNERIGRNPKTKEQITIPASKAPVFKAGKQFKESV